MYIVLEEHKPDQKAARNIRVFLEKCIPFSTQSCDISGEKRTRTNNIISVRDWSKSTGGWAGALRNVMVRKHISHIFQLEQNGGTYPLLKAENHMTNPPIRHGIFGSIIRKKSHYAIKLWCYFQIYFLTVIQNYAKIILFSITLATVSHDCKLQLDLLLFKLGLKACKAVIHLENGCSESWE